MHYSFFVLLALVLHLIINYDIIKMVVKKTASKPVRRYFHFTLAVIAYYISDIFWGILYGAHMYHAAFIDTTFYFAALVVSVLLWARFVVSFLEIEGHPKTIISYAGWALFIYEMLNLVLNLYFPVLFKFDDRIGYIPGSARDYTWILAFVFFFSVSFCTLVVATRSRGKRRIHNGIVAASGFVMTVFIILQWLSFNSPFYTVGCLIATCLVHIFVEEDRKIDDAIKLENARRDIERAKTEGKEQIITFGQIAESLASNYDVIYYVDIKNNSYVGYTTNNIFGKLVVNRQGDDFFAESNKNIMLIAHPEDKERAMSAINKDHLLTRLEHKREYSVDYRVIVDGNIRYIRLTIRKAYDREHLIVGVENIDDEVRKEQEHATALNTEKELARRDELTGIKNRNAYLELEKSVQSNMDNGMDYLLYALVVCDINDLKVINDTHGHKVGDDYIRSSARLLCSVFSHSPVFRIGGDEFVVFLRSTDFLERNSLIDKLKDIIDDNMENGSGPVIAVGMREYDPAVHTKISQIFDEADKLMYEDKKALKAYSNS